MSTRPLFMAAALAGALLSSTAFAVTGVATGSVNLRTGPGTGYAKITTIPAGAQVEVYQCSSWCDVSFGGARGFASASYIQTGGYAPPPQAVYQPAPPVYQQPPVYQAPPAVVYQPAAPVYAYRPPMPARAYWRHGRPWWDDRYHAWYDGRYWWRNNGWYDRPQTGIYFQFNG